MSDNLCCQSHLLCPNCAFDVSVYMHFLLSVPPPELQLFTAEPFELCGW